ncbi:MAG: alpha/beta hydrolase [Rhodothermales bacterium]
MRSNRLTHIGLMGLTLILSAGCASLRDAADAGVSRAVPATPDPAARYVIYLHGRIIEEEGERPTSPRYGTYEYRDVLRALARPGLHVISERRPAGTDMDVYAGKVLAQIAALRAAGVPADRITVVGFSKGGGIAVRVAARNEESDLRFVFLAACGDWAFVPEVQVAGRILSINEASDDLVAPSCEPLFAHARQVPEHDEIRIETGQEHGAFYRPNPVWVNPVTAWALGVYSQP